MNICVYGASSNIIDNKYIVETEKLGREMAKRGHNLIFGGGSGGMMGASARGVHQGGGKVIGIVPSFFDVDGIIYDKCDEVIFTETMRERKKILEERSQAFIIAPGGIGTFDEFFEIYTLKQLGRHGKAIVIYNVDGYYDNLLRILADMALQGFMSTESLKLIKSFDDINELLDFVEDYKEEIADYTEMKSVPTDED
ncbi:MAG: TIGR00730 family Rossman fold protein [Clostridia bacterium]|nr:TIGR00730 family Rossman fold protein [Clostridia bacterium]